MSKIKLTLDQWIIYVQKRNGKSLIIVCLWINLNQDTVATWAYTLEN